MGRYVRRSLAGTDGDYGPACAAPDMEERDVQLFQQKKKKQLDSLGNTTMERSEITPSTIDDREPWHRARRKRVTATSFHQIANMRDSTSNKSIMSRLLCDTSKDLDTPALQYGRVHEEFALQAYEIQTVSCEATGGVNRTPRAPLSGSHPRRKR